NLRGAVAAVSDGERVLLDSDQAGDEPVMLAHTLPGVPVVVGARRAEGARLAVEEFGAEVLVLDDGFQHLQLARDLDLVTVDARLPFANGHCFPRGLLRETPRSLRAADLVLLTRTRRVEPRCIEATRQAVVRHVPDRSVLTAAHAPVALVDLANGAAHPLQRLQGLKILAVAGIGQPELFFQDLKDLGAEVLQTVPYPDHHRFQREEVAKLDQWAGLMNADAVVTTEKDGVRLREFLPLAVPALALRIEVQVSDPGVLAGALDEMLQRRRSDG
ncbi:MAG TPA: tetraacyldisaccharide 4'-kinase, partial [Deferrisomatales bacterium]|nr:tetraacyldisaccharide 4'-kinase [Deferrisomatales bacterium]